MSFLNNTRRRKKVESDKCETKSEMSFLNNTRRRKKVESDKDERGRLMTLLDQFGGNISKVAKELGINRGTVYKKMKRHNLI
jgi:transcriptional regulator of acetoin/glycerol metabolism